MGQMGRMRQKTRRLLAAVGAALLLSFQAFSVAYLVHESHHDCCGEGCPVCFQLQQSVANLQLAGPGGASEPAPVEVPAACGVFEPAAAVEPSAITLVSLKVRLND